LTIREKMLGPDHPVVAVSLNNLADLYKIQGQYTQAELLYKRALAILEKGLGATHPIVATSYANLALLYRDQNRLRDGLAAIRQSTRILARRAKIAAENNTAQQSTAQASGADTFITHATLLGQILPSAAPGERAKFIDEAYAVAQRAGSGETGAALAQMAARASAGNSPLAQKVREQQDAVAAWRQFDKQLIDAIGKPAAQRNAIAEKYLRQKLSDTDRRITQLNHDLQRHFPEYRELVSPEPLSVSATQKLLKPDEALVAYLVADNETLLWVIRPKRIEMLRLEITREALSKQVALLRQGTDLSSGDLPAFPYVAAHALYKTLFAPAVQFLVGVKHVTLVADGPLQSLPFGMLLSAATPTDKDAAWLIRQHAFSNLPAVTSLRALRRFGKSNAATQPFMGFGDPILKGTPEQARGTSVAKMFARGALADTREVQQMGRLPETADELLAIAKTLKAGKQNVVLGEAATEQQVKQTNLLPFRVLAFATHGLMAGDFKGLAEPALVLTPPSTPSEQDDGLLTASEVAALRLNADWVVLSACNTAAHDGTPGADGFSGLTKAFFYAGSQTLVVSHWAVASVATVSLTTRMFTEAEKGIERAEALRRAMLAMINHSNAALHHPALWAPFVVVGEGGIQR
jgi:CHAT domain-containing protein